MKPSQLFAALSVVCALAFTVAAREPSNQARSGFIRTADGVRIHYLEAGVAKTGGSFQVGGTPPLEASTAGRASFSNPHRQPSILFVPGWMMPGWIWNSQIAYLSRHYRVVAMDPRSQGESAQTSEGLYPAAMARDIKAVIDQLHLAPVVLVGWSMAVKESLAYVEEFGTQDLAGLVLVDNNAGGFAPGEAEADFGILKGVLEDRQKEISWFVRNIQFRKPQSEEYVQQIIQAALVAPTSAAVSLLVGAYAADYRPTLTKIDKPTLVCVAQSSYMNSVLDMQKQIAGSRLEVFEGAGHALFVDDADQFNSMMENFLTNLR